MPKEINIAKQEIQIKKVEDELRLVKGEVYVPNEADAHGDYATAEEIRKAAYKFMKSLRLHNIDKQHDEQGDEGSVVESYIAKSNDPDGFAAGAWVIAVEITKADTWEGIKKGEITGFSMGGTAIVDDKPKEGGE